MGTVGINFGAATSGTGFNVATTVTAILGNYQMVEAPWKTQLTTLKAGDTALTSIGSDLSALSTSLLALTDFQGVMAAKQGSSSDPNVLSLSSAGPTAVAGSHTVVVSQLAQTSSQYSATVPPADLLSGGLTIQVGSGPARAVPVVAGVSDTLAGYAAAINLADVGVTASIISDTTGSRLSLVSKTSGTAGAVTISSGGTTASTSAAAAPAVSVASTASVAATNTFHLAASTDQVSGIFSYAVGPGSAATVDLGSTPLSLADAAARLNGDAGFAGTGLNASVNGASLVITGAMGASGSSTIDSTHSALTITTPAASFGAFTDAAASTRIAMTQGLPGLDATLKVDGVSVVSGSNTISTAIPGVTFQLLSSDVNTQVQVQIANDTSSAVSAFGAFVTAYNTVAKDIKTQEGLDSTGVAEPLFGSTVISGMQSALSLALTSGTGSGSINNLAQLGVSVVPGGTLSLDSTVLNTALNAHYQDVVGFLQNSGSFGSSFVNTIDQLGSQSPSGSITLALGANKIQETGLNANVTNQDALIAAEKITLTTQLNMANQILQAIPQQLNNVDQLYNALTGYTPKN